MNLQALLQETKGLEKEVSQVLKPGKPVVKKVAETIDFSQASPEESIDFIRKYLDETASYIDDEGRKLADDGKTLLEDVKNPTQETLI